MDRLLTLLTNIAGHPLLAADNKGFGQLATRSQNKEPGLDLIGLLVALGVMMVLALVAWGFSYWQRLRESRVLNSPRALFRELCAAHGLNRADRDLLYEIAQWHQIADPVQLFIEPHRFQPSEMHESLDCKSEAMELQTRLFKVEATPES